MNFTVLNDKIITSRYLLDMIDFIEKAEIDSDKKHRVLYEEFEHLILQGKITFLYLYCDRRENRIRGRVRASAGFRNGTQRLLLIPNNKWPSNYSSNETALRYYDFGRADWRSFRKDSFVVATSFWDEDDNKWKDNPYEAGFTSNWKKIKNLNKLEDYIKVDREDTVEEKQYRDIVREKEKIKREQQISRTNKKNG